jgi:transcriptional regulator with XRE-family HTH domain
MVRALISHEHLGEVIAVLRHEVGMTQGELGRATGLGQTAVSRIESGQRKVDTLELVDIASALAVDVAAVVERARELARERVGGAATSGVELLALRLKDPAASDDIDEALRWVPAFLRDYDRLRELTEDG